MAPIDIQLPISQLLYVSIALSCNVVKLVDVENIVTLKSGLEVTQGY